MAGRRKTPFEAADLEARLPELREAALGRGVLRARDLAGIPAAWRAQAFDALARGGLERLKTGVRMPLSRQLATLLRERGPLPVAQLARALHGASAREAKAAATSAAREGAAVLAVRGRVAVLLPAGAPALPRGELAALQRACTDLAGRCRQALKLAPATLLRDDVRALLLDFVAAAAAAPRSPPPADVVAVLRHHVRESTGLAFVPDLVRALSHRGVDAVHAALVEAARTGRIELQPESGMGRLNAEELDLCPPGPQGTRLSWARILEGAR